MQRRRAISSLLIAASGILFGVALPFGGRGVLGIGTAAACSCNPPPPPAAARDEATMVFVGQVTALTPPEADAEVTFRVERVYKGQVPATVTARTTAGAACGLVEAMRVGSRWLVYGNAPLRLSACSRTRPYESAAADLAAFGEGAGYPPVAAALSSPTPSATTLGRPGSGGCTGCATSSDSQGHAATVTAIAAVLCCVCRRKRCSRGRRSDALD